MGKRRGLREDDVRIGTAEAERIYARSAETGVAGKHFVLHGHAEFQAREVDVRIGIFEMQAGGNPPVLEHQRGLDQSGDTGRGFQMAEIGLYRADHQRFVAVRAERFS